MTPTIFFYCIAPLYALTFFSSPPCTSCTCTCTNHQQVLYRSEATKSGTAPVGMEYAKVGYEWVVAERRGSGYECGTMLRRTFHFENTASEHPKHFCQKINIACCVGFLYVLQNNYENTASALPSNFHIIPIEIPLKIAGLFCNSACACLLVSARILMSLMCGVNARVRSFWWRIWCWGWAMCTPKTSCSAT